eukprot:s2101_g19.t1
MVREPQGHVHRSKAHQCPEAPTVWVNKEKTLVILIHVGDMVLTGTPESLKYIKDFLQLKYKVAVEDASKIRFLTREIEMDGESTRIKINPKYLDGLVKLYGSGVGTLFYIAGDRPDCQFLVKELASKLQSPTRGLLVAAVVRHMVKENVELKVYGDNTSAVSIACKEGVGRLKHVDGRWQKRLMRLTLGVLLLGGGEALGQSSLTCLIASEAVASTPWTVSMLAMVNFILAATILILLKSAYNMHKRIEGLRKAMDWINNQMRKKDRAEIRAEEEARTGIYHESDASESEEEEAGCNDECISEHGGGDEPESSYFTRMVRSEGFESGEEENDPDMEEVTVEPEPALRSSTSLGYEMDDDAVANNITENGDMEESEESGFETDYGLLAVIEERDSDFEALDEDAYDDYRFRLLGDATGVEHYILKKLAYLRKMTMNELVWYEIRDLMKMHKGIIHGWSLNQA